MANETEKKSFAAHYAVLVILIVLVVFLSFEIISLRRRRIDSEPAAPRQQTAVSVSVAPFTPQSVTLSKKYIGYVTPVHSVDVLPFISGFVEKIFVQSGQFVREGQLLMILEQGEYKAQLDLARAGVMQAEAALENAATYYQRVQAAGSKAVAQADRDKAQAEYLSAKAALAQAQAQLAAAKVNYDYTIIRAPISGLIGTVEPTKGDYVSPAGTPLMTVIQTSPIQVVFSITDKDYIQNISENGLSDLLAGEKIKLQLANGEIYPAQGVYRYTDNALNRPTNSVAVYVNFENKDNMLLSNAYVTVYLEKELKDIVLIAQNQVELTAEGSFVTVADKQGIRRRKIEILDTMNSDYLVKNIFGPQEYLVKGKAPTLKENQPFRLNIVSENGG